MPLTSGTHLGAYEILAPLGAGGMGEVYRARHASRARSRLKLLPEILPPRPSVRFEREAHGEPQSPQHRRPALIEEDRGTRFLTMELVEGQSPSTR
jgi:serine/threonine protein kinase